MSSPVKRLAILGSTGSIGQQTLDIVRAFPQRFRIVGLAAGKNLDLLTRQIDEFKPDFACYDPANCSSSKVQACLNVPRCQFISREEIASHPDADLVVIATAGKAGLSPTLAAVKAGKRIALANKESLVMAGAIITRELKKTGATIIPVDSEHSAIWQCLNGEKQKAARIILTASGGPFYRFTSSQLAGVTVEQALTHPSWKMGKKVTIDSATMMNKGLEVMEAHWLFGMPYDCISILVHPECIVHSMVEFVDGMVKAQMGCPDMRLPIQYALSYPQRLDNPQLPRIDWGKLRKLTFEPPDMARFPCLKMALAAAKSGDTYPVVLATADELAVELFLAGRIKFTDIASLIEKALERHQPRHAPGLEEIMAADAWTKETVLKLAGGEK